MFPQTFSLLLCWTAVWGQGGFGSFGSNGLFQQGNLQQLGQGTGSGAAVGDAKTNGAGSATSINQANHEANAQGTKTNALSANSAQGDSPTVNGAAQAGGNFQSASQLQSAQFGQQQKTDVIPFGNGGFGNNGNGNSGVAPVTNGGPGNNNGNDNDNDGFNNGPRNNRGNFNRRRGHNNRDDFDDDRRDGFGHDGPHRRRHHGLGPSGGDDNRDDNSNDDFGGRRNGNRGGRNRRPGNFDNNQDGGFDGPNSRSDRPYQPYGGQW